MEIIRTFVGKKIGTDMEISLYASERIWQIEKNNLSKCRVVAVFRMLPTHIEDNAEQSSITRK